MTSQQTNEIKEVELVEDVVELIQHNDDVEVDESAQNTLSDLYQDDMIMVTKEIGSLKIKDVKHLDDDTIEEVMTS